MNLFEGLEQFGIKADETSNLFEEEKKPVVVAEDGSVTEAIPTEDQFLIEKGLRCPVCDKVFKTKMIKSGRIKRMEPDKDLRPRHEYIDTLKYDVSSCPFCGFTAISKYFGHLTSVQMKMIREQVTANFKTTGEEPAIFDYDYAIGRYKLALFNTMVKKGKTSEKAYTCLRLAWLYRGKYETLDPENKELDAQREDAKKQEEMFYQQAYEGLNKAVSTEMFPICGMDQTTLDYLLAVMASHFKKFDVASKCIANILSSQAASPKVKDKARDLKEEIVAEIRKTKQV